jgi:hypothetical protein
MQRTLAVISWHLEILSLFYFFSNMFVKAIIPIKNNFADIGTMTVGTTTTPCTQHTKQCFYSDSLNQKLYIK